jgi:hypothetical protein
MTPSQRGLFRVKALYVLVGVLQHSSTAVKLILLKVILSLLNPELIINLHLLGDSEYEGKSLSHFVLEVGVKDLTLKLEGEITRVGPIFR